MLALLSVRAWCFKADKLEKSKAFRLKVFTDEMIFYAGNCKQRTKRPINNFSKVVGYRINI